MSIEIFLSFLIASIIFGFIPGPSVCFTVAYGLRFGTVRTLPSILGQLAANSVQIFLVFIGLHTILEQSMTLFFLLKMLGAAYLIYIGIKQLRSQKPQLTCSAPIYTRNLLKNFLDGFIVCTTNPKAILYYAAFFPQFITSEISESFEFMVLGITSILVLGLILVVYTLIAGKTRYWLINKGYWRIQNRITGSLMIGAGTALALVNKR